jgi:signal peptidase I
VRPDWRALRKPTLDLLRGSGKSLRLKVEGDSMIPLLRPGDAVTIIFCSPAALVVGDVVAYEVDSGVAIHRVLRRVGRGGGVSVYQKGDNMRSGGWLDERQILGKVVSVTSGGREFSLPSASRLSKLVLSLRYLEDTIALCYRNLLTVGSRLVTSLSRR